MATEGEKERGKRRGPFPPTTKLKGREQRSSEKKLLGGEGGSFLLAGETPRGNFGWTKILKGIGGGRFEGHFIFRVENHTRKNERLGETRELAE